MRVTGIRLRNYRVYDDLDLELPPGVVGIYGANGAGKSALLESILFALWGKARTRLPEVRTTGVNADCSVEVQFEHEGHLYAVRRCITGANATVKAQAHADGLQVAEGVADTNRYVRSILGMGDAAFRASVFAEQRQLTAFSDHRPEERKKLVLQLLGITPLDSAKDRVRKEARDRREIFERQRSMLPDVAARRADCDLAVAAAERAASESESARAAEAVARAEAVSAAGALETIRAQAGRYELLVAEGRSVAAERLAAERRAAALAGELADLERASSRRAELAELTAELPDLEARWLAARALLQARAALTEIGTSAPVPEPDPAALEQARRALEVTRAAAAEVEGQRSAARAELDRAEVAARALSQLSTVDVCPMCGQQLGAAFEQVRTHHLGEVQAAQRRLEALEAEKARRGADVEVADGAARAVASELDTARSAHAVFARWQAQRQMAADAAARAEAVLEPPLQEGEAEELAIRVAAHKRADTELARLDGMLERRPRLTAELSEVTDVRDRAERRRRELLAEVADLGFSPEVLEQARQRATDTAVSCEAAVTRARAADLETQRASDKAHEAAKLLAEAASLHAQLEELGVESRHLARLAELLSDFRNRLVGTVGPRLNAQAGELFARLTDHAYDRLEVDPDTYEIRILDDGRSHGTDRFSGSETDLANLALRVAISEQVRFQSGGQVGLLVLDEVFGSLDDDRRQRLLSVLELLKARFRQILVVTHSNQIKDQLPQAIEVVKVGERRATARPLM